MNKIIKGIMEYSHFAFCVSGILLLGLKMNITQWIIVPFATLYIFIVLSKFELVLK